MSIFDLVVIGVDPGQTTGIAEVRWENDKPAGVRVAQCSPDAVVPIIDVFLLDRGTAEAVIAVEQFVDGKHAGRGNAPAAARTTRALVNSIRDTFTGLARVHLVFRSAAEVKPWANDERLNRAGLWAPTKGMNHARDAARHALFAAVRDGLMPDPMSARARARST